MHSPSLFYIVFFYIVVVRAFLHCQHTCIHGYCDYASGSCHCYMGYSGDQCDTRAPHECNFPAHWPHEGELVSTKCIGRCDTQLGKCYCPLHSKHPERRLYMGGKYCDANVTQWRQYANGSYFIPTVGLSAFADITDFFGSPGSWCDVDKNEKVLKAQCSCMEDGYYLDPNTNQCSIATTMFCLNQCNGHGSCSFGFCTCDDGWWGADCSVSLQKEEEKSKRPRIYVYELPPQFNTGLLQLRDKREYCSHRMYDTKNISQVVEQYYAIESFMHEALLASPYRTTNPKDADYFYVPVYSTCKLLNALSPSPTQWNDFDAFNKKYKSRHANRATVSSELVLEAYEYISQTHPFWNASYGKDHIFLFVFDEGSSLAPQKIRNATLLSHFGNIGTTHNQGTSTYDKWYFPELVQKDGLFGNVSTFDPKKDIVLPPPTFLKSTFVYKPNAQKRTKLFFFGGRLGEDFPYIPNSGPRMSPAYSLGIRQRVTRALYNKTGVTIVGHVSSEEYMKFMQTHIFCGSFPGDGWSGALQTAMKYGCIPVIIQDGILSPFHDVRYGIRVEEKDIEHLDTILLSKTSSEIEVMQQEVAKHWKKMHYKSDWFLKSQNWWEEEDMYAMNYFIKVLDEKRQCRDGILHDTVCCMKSCGETCGGRNCGLRGGGIEGCCVQTIMQSKRMCTDYDPPCIVTTN